jgi:membrane fusion protein (multidrug efflux system)
VAGSASSIEFESSTRVSAGDVLLRLDDSIDRAALSGLVADRQLARVQFERASNLLPRKAVSQSEFDEAKARYDAAQAKVAEQQARIAKKTIRAPFDGLLGLRQIDQGEYLTPGQTIVALQALDPIYVDYSVPERQFSAVSVDQPVEVTVDAYPGRVFSGRVTAIDSGVDEGTRSVDVRATLDNPEGVLRPGMLAEVRTLVDEAAPRARKILASLQQAADDVSETTETAGPAIADASGGVDELVGRRDAMLVRGGGMKGEIGEGVEGGGGRVTGTVAEARGATAGVRV